MSRMMQATPTQVVFDELAVPVRQVESCEEKYASHEITKIIGDVKLNTPYQLDGLKVELPD